METSKIKVGDRVKCFDGGGVYYGTVIDYGLKGSFFVKYDQLHWMNPNSIPVKRVTLRKDGTWRLSGTDYLVELSR